MTIPDLGNMTSLMQKMTNQSSESDLKMTDSQVNAMVEILVPRLLTQFPAMPKGMKCEFLERGDKHWVVRIERP